MTKINLSEFCAPGATAKEEMIDITENVALRVFTFTPAEDRGNPTVLFVAGWISVIEAWKVVLREMTNDFTIYYIETREKISSRVKGKAEYSTEAIGKDIVAMTSHLNLRDGSYILSGSSLGATAILDCCRHLKHHPRCLVLINPNAVFRVPIIWKAVVYLFYPPFWSVIKPVVKWYLRTFRMDVESDRAQYEKYCSALDGADPWKSKKAAMALWNYQVWDRLENIPYPALIVGASKDKLHEPENLKKIVSLMPRATYLDMVTNAAAHSKLMFEALREFVAQCRSER
ncbi:MAG: alpha/beta hydrolase [bacterium]